MTRRHPWAIWIRFTGALMASYAGLASAAGIPHGPSGSTAPSLHWLAGTADGRPSVRGWSVVARAPSGDNVVAYSRVETRERNFRTETVQAYAILYRVASDGTVTPVPLRDADGHSVSLGPVEAMAVAPTGEIYVTDSNRRILLAITPAGVTRVLAGKAATGTEKYRNPRDGDSPSAVFIQPSSLAVDKVGNLWVVDDRRLRIVSPQGEVHTFRGYPEAAKDRPWLGDGRPDPNEPRFEGLGEHVLLAADARHDIWVWINNSTGVGHAGNYLYRVTDKGQLQPMTLPSYPPTTLDPLDRWEPQCFTFGPDGTLFLINDSRLYNRPAFALWAIKQDGHGVISADSRVDWAAGVVRITALHAHPWKSPDMHRDDDLPSWPPNKDIARGYALEDDDFRLSAERDPRARVYLPSIDSLTMRGQNTLLAGSDSGQILEVAPNNRARLVADLDTARTAPEAPLATPVRRAVMAPDGSIYFIDKVSLRRVGADGKDARIARLVIAEGALDSTALPETDLSKYHAPADLILDPQGNVLIAEPYTGLIRKITPQGQISTVAGSGARAGNRPEDGELLSASFGMPQRLAMDSAGDVYVLDRAIRRTIDRGWGGSIRKIDAAAGKVTTVARAGDKRAIENSGGYADIAIGKDDQLLALDEDGTVWSIDDKGRHKAIAKSPDYLVRPKELAADRQGNLYIGSIGKLGGKDASLVARIDAKGVASVVMRPPGETAAGPGATSAQFRGLGAMRLTPAGDLLAVLGSLGGVEDGITWDPRVRNPQLPMDHNDSASGIAVIHGVEPAL